MRLLYAFLIVAILFALNVSFSTTYSEKYASMQRIESVPLEKEALLILEESKSDSLNDALEQAVWDNNTAQLLQLLREEIDVNRLNQTDGYAPIHWAVERSLTEVLKILLDHGADVNLMTSNAIGKDRTALHMAAELGDPEVIQLLLEYGADVGATTSYGETPLHGVRLFVKNIEVVQQLVESGANVNAETTFGATPLHSASILGSAQIVILLIERGAEINRENKRGLTPLHHAADYGHEDVVKVLLQSEELSLDLQTRNGDTALHLAAKKGHARIVELLLQAGANPTVENKFNKSPLAEARDRSYDTVVAILDGAIAKNEEGAN